MSTLTTHSSPTPAHSPRQVFHTQAPSRALAQSPRLSPHSLYPVPSPRRAFNAPAPASLAIASPKPSREHFVEGGATVGSAKSRYADAGTQYSPEGYPPTADCKVAPGLNVGGGGGSGGGDGEVGLQPPGSAGSAKKRKESSRSESPPRHQQMSGTGQPFAAKLADTPPEPSVRQTPAAASNSTPQHGELPQRTAAEQQPEPQEARSTHGHSSAPKRSRPDPATVKVMPIKYETCNPKDLGVLISNMLMELIRLNDQIPLRDGRLTRFHSRAPPGISVSDYLQRLIQHATLPPPILLSMVYYIDRLCALYPAFTINSLTVHRFLITAATVAAKGLSDSFWTNPTYARIGGIPVSELATLELEFLQKVAWKIVPKPELLEEYYVSLVDRTQGYELEASRNGSSSSSVDESDESPKIQDGNDEAMTDPPT